MSPIRLTLFAAAAGLALAACATPADETADGTPPERAIPEKPPYPEHSTPPPTNPGEETIMKCDDSGTSWAMGKLADEATVQRIVGDTHSKGVRVIKPGMAVTMDFREDRVNIDVDANNRITNVRCG